MHDSLRDLIAQYSVVDVLAFIIRHIPPVVNIRGLTSARIDSRIGLFRIKISTRFLKISKIL